MCITNNSEILFIYDAKDTNPNGDMENENKPRMDYDTNTNLVSDVRLKRYIRDYYESNLDKEIFITNKAENSNIRAQQLNNKNLAYTDLIDVRLFGAVYAAEGANTHLTGPVQFNWGYSLNKVSLVESSTITSSFNGNTGIGNDFRLHYSFIAFSGSVNALAAKSSLLTDDDLLGFDQAIVRAIPLCRTRSKIGQTPRIYIRIELKDNQKVLKDLREYVTLDYLTDEYMVRNYNDFTVNIDRLVEYLEKKKNNISKIYYWFDDSIKFTDNGDTKFKKILDKNDYIIVEED